MRRVALLFLLSSSACGALIGLEPPSYDSTPIDGGADGSRDGSAGDDGPLSGDAPPGEAASDAPIDGGADGDGGPIDPCAGASLCVDFEADGSMPLSLTNDGLVFLDTSVSHSPTHCLTTATNAPMGDYAYAYWPAGSYASGTRLSFWYTTAATFANGPTPIGQVVFSSTQTILRIYFTSSAVEIEWQHAGVDQGKASLAGRGAPGFSQVVMVIRDDGVRNGANAGILGVPPEALSGPMVLELGIVDNLGAAEAIRFDDVIVHPP